MAMDNVRFIASYRLTQRSSLQLVNELATSLPGDDRLSPRGPKVNSCLWLRAVCIIIIIIIIVPTTMSRVLTNNVQHMTLCARFRVAGFIYFIYAPYMTIGKGGKRQTCWPN